MKHHRGEQNESGLLFWKKTHGKDRWISLQEFERRKQLVNEYARKHKLYGTAPNPQTAESVDSIKKRFWSNVSKSDHCWNWIGHKTNKGYGVFFFHRKSHRAHRVSWKLTNGEIPNGLIVCHHCDNPSCVNPKHLFLGTQKDNVFDKIKKNRGNNPKGENHPRAILKEKDIPEIRFLYEEIGLSQRDIALNYGVSRGTINSICLKRNWSHVV